MEEVLAPKELGSSSVVKTYSSPATTVQQATGDGMALRMHTVPGVEAEQFHGCIPMEHLDLTPVAMVDTTSL